MITSQAEKAALAPIAEPDRRANSFDLLRLLAAAAVIYHHVFAIRRDEIPHLGYMDFGELGVGIFFAISGYLVTSSWRRAPQARAFFLKRALRIFPGLIASLILTVLVLSSFSTLGHAAYFSSQETLLYIVRNALLYPVTYELPGVFDRNDLPGVVNGSLWTLRLEFTFYIGIAALGLIGALRASTTIALMFVSAVVAIALYVVWPDLSGGGLLRLLALTCVFGFIFISGAWMSISGFEAKWWMAGISLALLFTPLWFLALPVLAIYLGKFNSPALPADISYGLYIYAFPIQQILSTNGSLNIWTSLALTVPIAVLSWFFVERPALAFKPSPKVDLREHLSA